MNPAYLRLTVLNNGVVSVSPADAGGDGPRVEAMPNGSVRSLYVDTDGSQILSIRAGSEIEAIKLIEFESLFARAQPPAERDSFGGPFVETTKPIRLPDGREGKVTVSKDASGHQWESGTVPQSDSDGFGHPGRTWVKITHPRNDTLHPGSHQGGETVELGRDRYTTKAGKHIDSNYTLVGTKEKDSMGRDTSVTVRAGYSPSTGREEHSSTVRADDGTRSWTNVMRQHDGSWSITTVTVDKDGNGTKHITEGRGDTVTRDETKDAEPSDAGPDKGDKDDSGESGSDPDPKKDHSGDSPTGDGEGTSEGNPDAGLSFDAVRLALLLGDDVDLGDGIDTLGDLDGLLRPWIDRIIATAKQGGGGGRDEALDDLGAPPLVGFDLHGYEEDELKDHDSMGRPRPIFGSLVEIADAVGAAQSGVDASTVKVGLEQLERVAQGFSLAAMTLNGAISAANPS